MNFKFLKVILTGYPDPNRIHKDPNEPYPKFINTQMELIFFCHQ